MKWGLCRAFLTKSVNCLWTLSRSFWCPLLILSYFWPFCSALPSPDGWWCFASDWFAPRYSVRALPFTLSNYRRSYEAYLSQCRVDIPSWGIKHPFGDVLAPQGVDPDLSNGVAAHVPYHGECRAGRLETGCERGHAVSHQWLGCGGPFPAPCCHWGRDLQISGLPASHVAYPAHDGVNVTIKYNSTSGRCLPFSQPQLPAQIAWLSRWPMAVHYSIFSAVAAYCSLFVVAMLRVPILRTVFGFRWLGASFLPSSL
nr:glycosylated envelope protein 2 [Porcine reproductive and respiratory syndrome virus]